MANVLVTLRDGKELVLPNTTVAAVITALGTAEGQASFTLTGGEVEAFGNENVVSLVQEAAGSSPGGAQTGGEESGSGRFPAS